MMRKWQMTLTTGNLTSTYESQNLTVLLAYLKGSKCDRATFRSFPQGA